MNTDIINIRSHKDLMVWQKAMSLVERVYAITQHLPKDELYGLTSQIRRAAVAIPANISEGFNRNHIKEYIQFLYIAKASGSELETLLDISNRLYLQNNQYTEGISNQLTEVLKMLSGLINKLKKVESPNT